MAHKPDSTKYWAASEDSGECVNGIKDRITRYREWLKESGRSQRMLRAWRAFYGYAPDGTGDTSMIRPSGEQGEFIDVTTNDYAILVRQTAVLTTANKPAFKAIATNSDYNSLAQAQFAQGLLEYYDKLHAIGDRDYEAVLVGLITSEGWQVQGWDASAGKSLTDFAEGQPTKDGDVQVFSLTPYDVVYDPDAHDTDSFQWIAFRRRFNRFDLAKTYPEQADRLSHNFGGDSKSDWADEIFDLRSRNGYRRDTEPDLIWVWEFRHLPTPALPNGRLIKMVDNECILFDSIGKTKDESGQVIPGQVVDSGYPYTELHAYRLSPEVVVGSAAGHTAHFDLLSLQECLDTVATQAATAANAGGISNMWCGPGGAPTLSSVVGSMNFLTSQQKPERMEGPTLSAQVMEFESFLERRMMRIGGQSDVSMGEVPKGMPGNLAALLEAKSVQYHSRLQASYARMLERSRTGMLKLLKRFATTPRVAMLAGKSNTWAFKEWSSQDIAGIDRVIVESVNAMSQTYAGRRADAELLLQHGLVPNAQQYLTLVATGRIEPMLDAPEQNLMRIRQDVELLQKGIGLPPVDQAKSLVLGTPQFVDDGKPHIWPLISDTHWLDIPENLSVLSTPEARSNPEVTKAVLEVVQERMRLWKTCDPLLQQLNGCPANLVQGLPMMGPPAPGGGPGSTPAGPPSPGSSTNTAPPHNGSPSGAKQPMTPGMPSGSEPIRAARPPQNPITGEHQPSPIVNGQQS